MLIPGATELEPKVNKSRVTAPDTDGKYARGRGRPRRNPPKDLDLRPSCTSAVPDNENEIEWVCCEKCSKWRMLPTSVTADDLPEICTLVTLKSVRHVENCLTVCLLLALQSR
jgi:hypothetical protein